MKKNSLWICFIFLIFASPCKAEGLDVLIQVAKSQAEIKKQYTEETRSFEKVKKAIESGAIKKGQTKSEIQAKYGRGIVAVKNLDGQREDWIYKPETSSFFKGIRATLVFTDKNMLDEARIEER